MEHLKPVWNFEQTIDLPLSAIEPIVFEDIHEGSFKAAELPFILSGHADCNIKKTDSRFELTFADGHQEFLYLDQANYSFALQGQWWYRGVFQFVPQGKQTLIKANVYNIAKQFRWVASLMILPERNKHKSNFEGFVEALKREVGR